MSLNLHLYYEIKIRKMRWAFWLNFEIINILKVSCASTTIIWAYLLCLFTLWQTSIFSCIHQPTELHHNLDLNNHLLHPIPLPSFPLVCLLHLQSKWLLLQKFWILIHQSYLSSLTLDSSFFCLFFFLLIVGFFFAFSTPSIYNFLFLREIFYENSNAVDFRSYY